MFGILVLRLKTNMKSERLNKLFFHGKANFKGNYILRVTDSIPKKGISREDQCLIISNNNSDFISATKKLDYKMLIILNDVENTIRIINKKIILSENPNLCDGDIVEISSNGKEARVVVLYRIESDDNTIIVTNACNNKCIMCPEPILRPIKVSFNITRIKKIIKLIDKKTTNIGISGGEPTLIKHDLVKILSMFRKSLPNTQLSLITNGRMFYYKSFVDAITNINNKNILFCIPLHSHKEDIHDEITQVKGSFEETHQGIKNLLEESQRIELRIVIQKKNYKELELIAEYIKNNFYGVYRVVFLGMEMSGMARYNRDKIWVAYKSIQPYLEKALMSLLSSGIQANIFNIPFCKISAPFRKIASNSISDYKIRYLSECSACSLKNVCGGSFASTLDLVRNEGVIPINESNPIQL